jgi:hypothetical protein
MPDVIKRREDLPVLFSDMGDGTYAERVAVVNEDGSTGLTDAQLRAAPVKTADQNGTAAVIYTTNTTAVTNVNISQIMCLTTTTFSVLTRTGATGSLAGVALPAGTLLIGPFTAYTLTSGAVAAYA